MATAISLPDNPRLSRIRDEARALQRAVRAGDTDAIGRITAHHPDPFRIAAGSFPLSAAQLVVARGYGFASWPRLRHHLDVIEAYRRDSRPDTPPAATVSDEFCRLACLTYSDDPLERRRGAGDLLAAHPDLVDDSVWAAAAATDVAAIRRHLAADRSLAGRDGGPSSWAPLYYLTYSRADPDVSLAATLTGARLLLDAGADPNVGYLWNGLPSPFTALTGVFGEGEQGPRRSPRHPHSIALARLLLDAGADPNDAQTLYNRMFRPDDDHLELLFAYGLGTGDGGVWKARLGDALASPAEMVNGQLAWAVRHGFADRVRLLIRHGVDVRTPIGDRSAIEIATANGDTAIVEALTAAGAPPVAQTRVRAFVAACLSGDRSEVERLRAADPTLLDRARAKRPALVAHAVDVGRTDAIDLLVSLGFDVNATMGGATALHTTAWNGDIAVARVLLAAGADPDLLDATFDATPLGWAEYAGQEAYAAFIAPYTGG